MTEELGLGQTKARLGLQWSRSKNGNSEGHLAIERKYQKVVGPIRGTDNVRE